jgi:hypothetical protein
MPTARAPSLLLTFVLTSIGGLAHANDGVMGGAGSDLLPMKTSDVSMVSEDIQLTYEAEYWFVEADYVFRNNTKGRLSSESRRSRASRPTAASSSS